MSVDARALDALRRAVLDGGVAVVPTDTVYGLAAAVDVPAGVTGLYALKGRPRSQPCQVLLYSPRLLEDALDGLPAAVMAAAAALLPGPATCLVPDIEGRYVAAAGAEPGSVGLRAPTMPAAFAAFDVPLIATSANHPGGADPRRVAEVPSDLRGGAACVLDLGELPGIASAVVDLRPVARGGSARLVRPGPDPAFVEAVLGAVGCTLAP
ncbi:MAG: L-threonylcarbamoyladenylate synthase [Thermoleophilia bacterium]|jgi:L-threonylcarbamoyladenylate synthase